MGRIIHTADWQIGKPFRFAGPEIMALLQQARIDAITTLGEAARDRGVIAVLVAGDVYDIEGPTQRTLLQPIERMRAFSQIEWHLIPGNHDSHRPGGIWDRLKKTGLPDNIFLHLEPVPRQIAESRAWVLPAPLLRRHMSGDPTEAMSAMETPSDATRIGLAHGSIADFGSKESLNRISVTRARDSGLEYLALGDWHGWKRIDERTWYSGTPEPDRFGSENQGHAVLVDVDEGKAEPIGIGRYEWLDLSADVYSPEDIGILENRIRTTPKDTAKTLVRLTVSGSLSLADRAIFDERVGGPLAAALAYFDVNSENLGIQPTEEDLDAIDHAGIVRAAVEKLRAIAADPGDPRAHLAPLALQRLYSEHMRSGSAGE